MIKLEPCIAVEGKYDKIKLSQIFDTEIIELNGFGLFNDAKKTELLRRIANTRGLVVLTDSDGAGLVIRNRIKSTVKGKLYHAYIPDIFGKEKRKDKPSCEGKLGVEGVSDEIIINAVKASGAMEIDRKPRKKLTKQDMYELGLSGHNDSKSKRKELIKKLGLPENLSANSLLSALNALSDENEIKEALIFSASEMDI